jgi:hypothetical protein
MPSRRIFCCRFWRWTFRSRAASEIFPPDSTSAAMMKLFSNRLLASFERHDRYLLRLLARLPVLQEILGQIVLPDLGARGKKVFKV